MLRYPTCAIFNPTNSPSRASASFIWVAPRLVAGSFGGLSYGVDPLGGGAPYGVAAPDSGATVNIALWAGQHVDARFWAYRRAAGLGIYLFSPCLTGVPPSWWVAAAPLAGSFINGVAYLGAQGSLPYPTRWNVGYSKSTDIGCTWSNWVCPEVHIPGYYWWDATGFGSYSLAMAVNANNRVHFFGVVVDSATQQRGLLELCETDTAWTSRLISTDIKESTLLNYGDITDMGHAVHATTNSSGTIIAVEWLDAPVGGDTLPDIWFSWRGIADETWSPPENITMTPSDAELLVDAARFLRTNGPSSYSLLLMRTSQPGVYPPNAYDPAGIYFGSYPFVLTGVREFESVPTDYALAQNHPNPFNPETKIGFQVPSSGFVSLKVFNLLGQEVATLVEGELKAGNHEVMFNGESLPSGVYLYRLSSQHGIQVKKMVLMR
jgi:hypothetical protein